MRSLGLVLAVVLVLAGCATPPPATEDWPGHRQALARLDHWQLQGKIGYRSPEDNGSAWVRWRQAGDRFQLDLSGPFGAGAARIEGGEHYAILRQSGREPIEAASAAELTVWLFGLQLPVEAMQSWIKGIPADSPKRIEGVFSDSGRLASLEQGSWRLEFADYRRAGDWVLPGRVQGTNGTISFTFVVKEWQPGGSGSP